MYSLGIDIGYSSIKFVLINKNYEVMDRTYILHKGSVKEEIDQYIKQITSKYGYNIMTGAVTGQGSKFISEKQGITWMNEVTALVEGSRHLHSGIHSVIEIGGQSSKYITNMSQSDNSGIKISINSNCSAGTGSFLEEQVSRLGIRLEDYSAFAEKAASIPRIAGRCSVFAKTDIIHHQQEGIDAKDILLGLAYALVKNYRANVIKKNPVVKPILFTGGVAYNKAIARALKDILQLEDDEIIIPGDCGNVAALGAAIIGFRDKLPLDLSMIKTVIQETGEKLNLTEDAVVFPPLKAYGKEDSLNKHICKAVDLDTEISGYIGLDIGSTSTNVVLMDQESYVIGFKYLRTLGDPVEAVRKGLLEIRKDIGKDIRVLGVGATGSGRYLAGSFVGADVIIDEITAQAKAAYTLDKEVDTIVEIGGQDSKFIKLENGAVSDFEMNRVCAAGTGSFIEEQAKKLNIPISEFGNLAIQSDNPVDLGDRCTVFIETNIAASLSNEAKIEDIAAGLAYSIVKNYLNKVVGKKEIGKKVFFQGGVAYNQAVLNAFRAILGDKLEVPEFFSVTGAYGAAILAKDAMQESHSLFRGFDYVESHDFKKAAPMEIKQANNSTKVFEETEKYYLEGYEKTIDPNKKTVGIPRVLFLHKLFPLFNSFFKELGFNVILSDNSSDKTVELSQEFSMEETCYPIKLINGHVAQLMEKKVDYIFLPSLYTMSHPISTTRQNYGCVYMQCFPKLINKTMELERQGIELLSPALSFEFGKKYIMKTLMKLGQKLERNPVQTGLALAKGMKSLKDFELKVERLGEETIKSLGKDEKAFVIVTRAYGIADPVLNMGIPEKLEKLGYKVLTLSNLPAHDHDTSKEHPNMYWPFGQHILSGAQIIKQHPNLYPIYITNHGCGPDTVLAHYFKEEMKGKPYLNIEVDEHFSSVGVLTRIEAFVNSLKAEKGQSNEALMLKQYSQSVVHKATNIQPKLDGIDKTTVLYLPYMYPYSQILAAYLKTKGYEARVLPLTTKKTLDLGRKYTLSKEYLSFTGLLGDVLNKAVKLKESNEKYGFIIPTSEGAEVNGQYYRLLRDKLDEENLHPVEIIAPFVEDVIKDSTISKDIFLMLLGGDLINLAPSNQRKKYFDKVYNLITRAELSIDNLKNMAKKIQKDMEKLNHSKKIFVVGEVNVLFNDFMNNHAFKRLEEQGTLLLYAPLSEYMWFVWRDYLSQKGNKKEIAAHNALNQFSGYIKEIAEIFVRDKFFEKDIESLVRNADKYLGFYSGGNGRYRIAKILGDLSYVEGVITVSSMYENTNTILNILSQDENKALRLPVLNMTFDGNENEIDQSKIDSFTYYALQENNRGKTNNKRGA
ncbi:acyl-CoA dehydratase activase [Geosporobacter ferrireducens]|uniref:CoA activase n=1 Tax=Geosporobacter ferrireducens TaxID=1424294 RepID=A0A1D8GQ60_9FIRM|nr:acyl-CoA dehydratase activase [Geosporobacter ferrireducens]AOT73003.1 CoA activase [Geosporobacter ferrireducens]